MEDHETRGIPDSGPSLSMQMINVAATYPATRALGPGLRSVLWVQGCAFHCPGCIAPDWIPIKPARLMCTDDLVEELLFDPRVTGITLSGGEPMLQAAGLARLVRLARKKRDIDIICFTGFQRAYLEENPPGPGVDDLLSQIDVLIDGPYIARLNDNLGLRGSRNQKIHYLSSRLQHIDFEQVQRKVEIHIMDGNATLIGVPPARLGEAYNQAINTVNGLQMRLVQYERV